MTGKVESVWDYPRPPRLEPVRRRLRVVFADTVVADSARGVRVLETSHPPTYYLPQDDVRMDLLIPAAGRSRCEWKGTARYWTIVAGERRAERAAWSYPSPSPVFAALKDHLSFYASRLDACFVDDQPVQAQDGDFYGGWITTDIVGPFKGAPGTLGW